MKKVILAAVFLAVVAAGALFVWKKVIVHRPRAAELVPAETIVFAQIPDALTSVRRFSETSLFRIFDDPEVQRAFGSTGEEFELIKSWRRLALMLPREGFIAVTSVDGSVPKFVAGFAYTGRRKDAEDATSMWRSALRESRPAGRGDLVMYGTREIETFTDKDFVVAEVFCDGWYFIADDLELLHRTIDRHDGKGAGSSLATSELYRDAIAPLPSAPDALLVVQTATLVERVASLMVAAGQKSDPKEFDELRKVQAISASMKFDGAHCRDSIFILRPGLPAEQPLEHHALTFSSPATRLYYALRLPTSLEISEETGTMLGLVPGWDQLNQALTQRQLTLADLPKAFGPECGSLVNWPKEAETASVLVAVDVRDSAKAAAFVDLIANAGLNEVEWTKSEQDGAAVYSTRALDFTPTIALTDKFMLIGFSTESVANALTQTKNGTGRLDATPTFTSAAGAVTGPTAGFGYVDFRQLFELGYEPLKSFIGLNLAFGSEGEAPVDTGRLPAATTISRHLTPIVYSQATTAQGTLIESTGPVTFNQLLLGGLAGVIGATLPTMEAALADGSLDPAQLLKSLKDPAGAALEAEPAEPELQEEPAIPATEASAAVPPVEAVAR